MGAVRDDALTHLEHHLHETLREMQDRRQGSEDFDHAPGLAAHHLRTSMGTARLTNAHGLHAISLSLTRQAFEALMVIDVGLIATDPARATLQQWYSGTITAGELRKWLAGNAWGVGPLRGLWDEPWPQLVMQLSRALQPYSHFTPELLQWNFNQVTPLDRNGKFIVAIGMEHVDQSRLVRLGVLRGVLLWMLGTMIAQYDDADPNEVTSWDLPALAATMKSSGWLISESDWGDNLIPHLMDRPKTSDSHD